MLGSRAICNWVVKTTPNMAIMMTASKVVTLCWIQNFAVFMGGYASPAGAGVMVSGISSPAASELSESFPGLTIRTRSPSER